MCPQCWMDEPLLEAGATLIVTPISLRSQWCNEIANHLQGDFKILNYEGHGVTPVYPMQILDFDIIITTYAVLMNELVLTETNQVTIKLL